MPPPSRAARGAPKSLVLFICFLMQTAPQDGDGAAPDGDGRGEEGGGGHVRDAEWSRSMRFRLSKMRRLLRRERLGAREGPRP